jgi:hypothetical protein
MIIQWQADKYPPLGRCVYCGETNPKELTKEHIIPFTLLPKGGIGFFAKRAVKLAPALPNNSKDRCAAECSVH